MNDRAEAAAAPVSAWAPFRTRIFPVVWAAVLVGHMGTWIRDVGAGWMMVTLSPSATLVAMVQVATTLPIFLLALPAGALADRVDRRRLVVGVCVAMAAIPIAMGEVARRDAMTPELLIAGLLAAGAGTAILMPVQQSLTPRMVPRELLRSAIALNSTGVNVARAIGPALGGLVIVHLGVHWTFWLDAASYGVVALAYLWWRDAATRSAGGDPERLGPAMRGGLRYALNAPALRTATLRAVAFFAFASSLWALLPLVARRGFDGGPGFYGLLLGAVGVGAVAGAVLLPQVRRVASSETVMRGGTIAFSAVLVAMAVATERWMAVCAAVGAGACWLAVLTTAGVAVQTAVADWVRGRALAVYLTAFYGAMTLGSLVWGQVADRVSVGAALIAAALAGLASLCFARRRPMPEDEPDLAPSLHWPPPPWTSEPADRDRGPVRVTVCYRVDPDEAAAFLAALRRFGGERRRDGAHRWGVFEDPTRPGVYVESFELASWADHLRQHARVTRVDARLQREVLAFHRGEAPPQVTHLVAAGR